MIAPWSHTQTRQNSHACTKVLVLESAPGETMTCDSCVRAFVSPKVMAVTNFLNALLIGLVGVMYFMYMPEICTKLCPSDVLCGFYCVRRILACVSHTPPPSSHHQPHPLPAACPLLCLFFRFLSRSNFAPRFRSAAPFSARLFLPPSPPGGQRRDHD